MAIMQFGETPTQCSYLELISVPMFKSQLQPTTQMRLVAIRFMLMTSI